MDGKWKVHDTKTPYDDEWLKVHVVDVELPDGSHIDHHTIEPKGKDAVNVVAHEPGKGILLIWRHRFITDTWGWELPAGAIEKGESAKTAAEREMLEETGWQASSLVSFLRSQPLPGLTVNTFESFYSESATWVGPGRDTNEAADIAWMSIAQVRKLIEDGELTDGPSITALLYALTFGPLQT